MLLHKEKSLFSSDIVLRTAIFVNMFVNVFINLFEGKCFRVL